MPGMAMGTEACPPEHAAMGHCQPAAIPAELRAMSLPPPAPTTRAADRFYDPAVMAPLPTAGCGRSMAAWPFTRSCSTWPRSRSATGATAIAGTGEGWFGGDIHRLVVKSEGEGDFGDRVGAAEVQ
jgi:copper resistance protein B